MPAHLRSSDTIPSLAVEHPEISEVMNLDTGEYRSLEEVVGGDFGDVIRLRAQIKDAQLSGRPLYVCSECTVPVSLLMHPGSRRFFFKHMMEDDRCSAVTRGSLTREEINARKYNGAKESRLHIRMKQLVVLLLEADPRFHDIETEARWTDTLTGAWRRPDVRAIYTGTDGIEVPVVFEIQLSTTFLDVIVERRRFYLQNGGLLFWVFADFPDIGRRLIQDDVFYNNNYNAFLVSEETKIASDELSEFCLTCIWHEPSSNSTGSVLCRKTVSFRDLTFDMSRQRGYYYDYEKARTDLVAAPLLSLQQLREEFEQAWLQPERDSSDVATAWKHFYSGIHRHGVRLRDYSGPPPSALVDALYSAKHGRVVGWRYKKFIEVAHRVASAHPCFLSLFRRALHEYDRGGQLSAEDRSNKWAERVKVYRAGMKRGDAEYVPDAQFDESIILLFPELFE